MYIKSDISAFIKQKKNPHCSEIYTFLTSNKEQQPCCVLVSQKSC